MKRRRKFDFSSEKEPCPYCKKKFYYWQLSGHFFWCENKLTLPEIVQERSERMRAEQMAKLFKQLQKLKEKKEKENK